VAPLISLVFNDPGLKFDPSSDAAFVEFKKLRIKTIFIACFGWRIREKLEPMVTICLDNLGHRYKAIREELASMLWVCTSAIAVPEMAENGQSVLYGASNLVAQMKTKGPVSPFQAILRADKRIVNWIVSAFERIQCWRKDLESRLLDAESKEIAVHSSSYGCGSKTCMCFRINYC
jgi:hypothetical protein